MMDVPPSIAELAFCKVGYFVEKGGCFALREANGKSVWLELAPIPLHLLDEEVEIIGRQYGPNLVWVQWIGPVTGRAEPTAHDGTPNIMLSARAHLSTAQATER